MNTNLVKKLLKKTDLIKYCYINCSNSKKPIWTVDYLLDSTDRNIQFSYIESNKYDLNQGIYLYHCSRHRFKLIAIIKKENVKIL